MLSAETCGFPSCGNNTNVIILNMAGSGDPQPGDTATFLCEDGYVVPNGGSPVATLTSECQITGTAPPQMVWSTPAEECEGIGFFHWVLIGPDFSHRMNPNRADSRLHVCRMILSQWDGFYDHAVSGEFSCSCKLRMACTWASWRDSSATKPLHSISPCFLFWCEARILRAAGILQISEYHLVSLQKLPACPWQKNLEWFTRTQAGLDRALTASVKLSQCPAMAPQCSSLVTNSTPWRVWKKI